MQIDIESITSQGGRSARGCVLIQNLRRTAIALDELLDCAERLHVIFLIVSNRVELVAKLLMQFSWGYMAAEFKLSRRSSRCGPNIYVRDNLATI